MSINQNFPAMWPSLTLDFANSKTLDPRVTFTRASTATYIGGNGLVKNASINQARFDHDPITGESLGLLIEESRTNLITYSSNSPQWPAPNNVSYSLSSVLSPDGESYAYEMIENTSNFYHAGYPNLLSLDGSSQYTISAWLKKGPNYRIDIANGAFQLYCSRGTGSVAYIVINSNFDSIIEHSNTNSRSLTQYSNGWIKVTYTFTSNAVNNVLPHFLFGGGGSYLGDGANSVYIWGVQVEVGSFPTSYIPTSGSSVTRSADVCYIDGTNFSSWYNQNEGSIFASLKSNPGNRSGNRTSVFGITPVSGPWIGNLIGQNTDGNGSWYSFDSSFSDLIQTSNLSSSVNKFSWGLTSGSSSSVVVDGTIKSSFNWGSVTRTSLFLSYDFSGSMRWNRILYYPTRLTNTQLQNLTK
jgi:hypothetical protein